MPVMRIRKMGMALQVHTRAADSQLQALASLLAH